jgi:hypothetical protein
MIGVTVTGGTPAAQCKGNACRSVLFEVDGGCSTATNLSGKTIVVEWGGYELKLGAGASKSIRKDGRCVEEVDGPISANFG